ncbi:hypothetical protein MHYP_G00265780 [Metynnis hypsauchen]
MSSPAFCLISGVGSVAPDVRNLCGDVWIRSISPVEVSASSAYLLIVPGGRNERWTGRHDEMIAEKWSDERRTGRGEQECGWEDK